LFFIDDPFLDDVCLSDTCNGVDLSSFSNEFNSARFPAVPIALSCSLLFFFDRDLSFSDEDVDESSSGWRVNRSNISAGSTAPSDKIRFPPTFALVGAAATGFRVSVGSANEKSDPLDRPVLPLGPFLRQFSARWRLTLLIENDPEASGGSFEETGAFFLAAAGLERPPFDGSFHPTEVFGHPGFGESEFGFADGEEENFQWRSMVCIRTMQWIARETRETHEKVRVADKIGKQRGWL
jgi:hypothetical protein